MNRFFILLFLLLSLTCRGQTKKEDKSKITVDTSKIAIIPYAPTSEGQKWLFKNSTPAKLNFSELNKAEEIFMKFIRNHNAENEKSFKEFRAKHPDGIIKTKDYVLDFSDGKITDGFIYDSIFVRQYIPVRNKNGEKEIWINCLCNTHNYKWKKELIRLYSPPYNCYFELKINLNTGTYYDFVMVTDE